MMNNLFVPLELSRRGISKNDEKEFERWQSVAMDQQMGYLHLALCSAGCWSPLESLDWMLSENQMEKKSVLM